MSPLMPTYEQRNVLFWEGRRFTVGGRALELNFDMLGRSDCAEKDLPVFRNKVIKRSFEVVLSFMSRVCCTSQFPRGPDCFAGMPSSEACAESVGARASHRPCVPGVVPARSAGRCSSVEHVRGEIAVCSCDCVFIRGLRFRICDRAVGIRTQRFWTEHGSRAEPFSPPAHP